MKNTHTPGPWEIGQDGLGISVDADGVPVCMCDGPVEDNEANARLIAAAPDLLVAGQHILQVAWNGTYAEQESALQSLRAAIAKAEGRE